MKPLFNKIEVVLLFKILQSMHPNNRKAKQEFPPLALVCPQLWFWCSSATSAYLLEDKSKRLQPLKQRSHINKRSGFLITSNLF